VVIPSKPGALAERLARLDFSVIGG